MTHTVIGFFRNSSDAENAADALKREGFDENDIDISSGTEHMDDHDYKEERSGKVANFFKSLFNDNDDDAERYTRTAGENSLVSVYVNSVNEAERAANMLDLHGAIEVNEPSSFGVNQGYRESDSDTWQSTPGSYYGQGDTDTESHHDLSHHDLIENDSDSDRFRTGHDDTTEASVPIIEEDVNIGKREVRRDKVRVRSRIVERPVEETLRLREESIHVERNPVDRDVTDSEMNDFKEETIEVEAYGEEPLISKRARVVEEVRVGKKVNERRETVRETRRKTEVDIDHDQDKKENEQSGEIV